MWIIKIYTFAETSSNMKSLTIVGWLGGDYEKLGFYDYKEDAERGIFPDIKLHEELEPFKGKSVKITVELIEED